MNRRAFAIRLTLLVALAGLLPIGLVGGAALEVLRRRSERSSQEALQAVAEQAAARIGAYVAQQKEMTRALAAGLAGEADAARRFAEVPLDAPSLGKLSLVGEQTRAAELPRGLDQAALASVFEGRELSSPTYLAADLTPAMEFCVPARALVRKAVCATLDLLELQRQVQRIRIGESGYALAFDADGRLLASGLGALRAAVITGERIAESPSAALAAGGGAAPRRARGGVGEDVLAGWATLQEPRWVVAVEQPAREALQAGRNAEIALGAVALAALLASLLVGVAQAARMLRALGAEERWRTAGLIASGITHDLGHRLAILQQTAALAETNDPVFLPRIRENLTAEVGTLRRFVADFADLTRPAQPAEFLPLELGAFLHSVKATASAAGEKAGVTIEVAPLAQPIWVKGDRYLLERAALNLLNNALEASPSGGKVALQAARVGPHALLQIVDGGGGIAPERLAGLFDAFASTKRTGAHVGIGLPNVRRIALAHGGLVSVASRLGAGSTFTLRLPLLAESAAP